MSGTKLSRRALIQVGLGAAATTGLVSVAGVGTAKADWDGPQLDGNQFRNSLDNSYAFLDTMMDAYATGSTVRLMQSYSDQIGLQSTAFVYDNALAIMAYLLRRRGDDVARARTLGDGLLYAQTHDPNFSDGRVRQGYFVNSPDGNGAYVQLALFPFYFTGMAVGDMAWSGMALAQLYRATGDISISAQLQPARSGWGTSSRQISSTHAARVVITSVSVTHSRQTCSPISRPSTTSTVSRSSTCWLA